MVVRYKLWEVAKDFNKSSNDIKEILSKFFNEPYTNHSALENKELDIIFDILTQENSVESFNEYLSTPKSTKKFKESTKCKNVSPLILEKNTTPYDSKNSFVFISYSTQNSNIAEQTKSILESNNISCWMAPQSIPAGSDYGTEIPKAISECSVFLLILSKESQISNWVPKEVGLAIGKSKIVVPFQIDNAVISDSFDFYLTNNQRIIACNRLTEAYQELVSRLKELL